MSYVMTLSRIFMYILFNNSLMWYQFDLHRVISLDFQLSFEEIWISWFVTLSIFLLLKMKNYAKFEQELTCWHEEFDKFWPEHSKVSEIFTLMGFFWAKYILFKLRKYRGVIFHETEEGYKIWRGIDPSFQNWHKDFEKIWSEHLIVSKIFILMGSFWAKYILFELKKVQRNTLS